ncbi:MAG: response regulator [Candidatus Kuenenia sp.]|nr:response regulator [Candidatus Kuenenia hertensis]
MTEKERKEDRVKDETANTRTILVVEDDEGLSRLIAKHLRKADFDVAVANSGTQAIDRIAGNPTDLVLLDYKLGDMFAAQVVEVFNERQFKIPFVIMTGHGDEKIAVEMMKSGARDYIVKEGEFFALLPSIAKRIFEELQNEEKLTQANKALEESERKYRSIVDNALVGVYKTNLRGDILYANRALSIMLGYESPEELMLYNVLQIYKNKNERNVLFDKLKKSGGIDKFECEVISTNGDTLNIILSATLAGNTVSGVVMNITEKIRLQAENMRAGQLAIIGELAAGAAHEINNPIYGIINYAQLIADESDGDSRTHKFGKLIIEEGNRIADITKNLLSLSRGKTNEKRPVQIYELFTNSLKLTKVQLKKDNIIIKDNIPKNIPAIIVNPQEIHQVFLNLIQNARYALNEKYPGKDNDKILEISCSKLLIDDYPYVRIIFYDRGIGIPENILSKVTNPFFTTKPHAGGTGLGLSISQNIINNHDGKMTIESTYGEFTNIIIDLPAEKLTTKNENKDTDN